MELSRDKIKEIINDDWLLMDDCEGNKNCDVVKEMARIALASLEAEKKILYRERNPYNGMTTGWQELAEDEYEFIKDNAGENAEFRTVYTAPPAPVSVAEWTNEQCLEFLSIAFRHAEIKGDLELDDIRLGVKMVNGSRAAMLNQEKSNG